MTPIQLIDLKYTQQELEPAQAFLDRCPYWDLFKSRSDGSSPHREVSDIWAHWSDPQDPVAQRNDSKQPMFWYYSDLERVLKPLIAKLYKHVDGQELGLVLLTRIPANKQVYAHTDNGYNQQTYTKYCICVEANEEQEFNYEDATLKCKTGDTFWFRNDLKHWVTNPTQQQRTSLIVCIKTTRGLLEP